ncbi:GNAT family N-acetyltransferase [Brachybacterium sp. YJGR34]|uniref:GNAT family N-acetyltransferase n=1 Tax=Brachybacterium sp. YJGR34 TaxID=2059911 RepID=UPI000E0A03FE|nr:GNAT family N-acetyltransferase [Brachybacterium sp. YJGR34]
MRFTDLGARLDALVQRLRDRARPGTGGELRLGERTYRIGRARREDVPAIRDLLRDDALGRDRELTAAEDSAYQAAFDRVARDPAHLLAVVRDEAGEIVGTMQLTLLPGLSRQGATRLQIEAVRVARTERSRGLGGAMFAWAHSHGRARGATLAQLTTDLSRDGARAFYARLGYEESHAGLKRPL